MIGVEKTAVHERAMVAGGHPKKPHARAGAKTSICPEVLAQQKATTSRGSWQCTTCCASPAQLWMRMTGLHQPSAASDGQCWAAIAVQEAAQEQLVAPAV